MSADISCPWPWKDMSAILFSCPLSVCSVWVLGVSCQDIRVDPVLRFSLCWCCLVAGRSPLLSWLHSSHLVAEVPHPVHGGTFTRWHSPEQTGASDGAAWLSVTHDMLLLFKWPCPIYFWDRQLHCKFLFIPVCLAAFPGAECAPNYFFCYPSLFFSGLNLISLFSPYS